MVDYFLDPNIQLLDYVKTLENMNNLERRHHVRVILESLGFKPILQENRFLHIQNIIIDFSQYSKQKHLLFSAHYDAVKGSPAANDNASGVAVLLGLCHVLKNRQLPIKVVFFDREEAWIRLPMLRLGLLGSLYYVLNSNLSNVTALYNLEFCGSGDRLAIWPVRSKEEQCLIVRNIVTAASQLKIRCSSAHIPWVFISSDHLSFRLKGMSRAITLSLIPEDEVPILENLVSNLRLARLLTGHRPVMPGVLSHIHTVEDTSSRLNENSLRLMLSLLMQIICNTH